MVSSPALEAGLASLTSILVVVCLALQQRRAGAPSYAWETLALAGATLASVLMDSVQQVSEGAGWQVRRTLSPGVHLGALCLPWVFASQLASSDPAASPAFARWALAGCLASSAGQLALLALRARQRVVEPDGGRGGREGEPARALGLGILTVLLLHRWSPWPAPAAAGLAGGPWELPPGAPCLAGFAGLSAAALHAVMAGFPGSTSVGEGMLLAQATTLLFGCVGSMTVAWWGRAAAPAGDAAAAVPAVVAGVVAGVVALSVAFSTLLPRPPAPAKGAGPDTSSLTGGSSDGGDGKPRAEVPAGGAGVWALVGLLGAAAVVELGAVPWWLLRCGVLGEHLLPWVAGFVGARAARGAALAGWGVALGAALPLLRRAAARGRAPTLFLRKGFHLLAVAMFAPVAVWDGAFLQLAMGGALAVLLLVEVARVHGLPPLGPLAHKYMVQFTDARDTGPLLLSHFSLLLGIAGPLWLCPRGRGAAGLAPLAGILSLGVADTFASAVGKTWGRRPVCAGSPKTLEGTLAGWGSALLCAAGLLWLLGGGGGAAGLAGGLALAASTGGMALMEAVTAQLDNAFVPLHYATLLTLAGCMLG